MDELLDKVDKTLEHIRTELSGIRSGRAHPALIEEVQVQAYESQMRLRDIATITVPEPRILEVRVWDAAVVDAVASALEQSDLGTSPNIAGNVIRIALPPLTDERRVQLNRLIGNICEEARVALRNERDTANAQIKKQQKSGALSEDELFRRKDEVDEAIKKANAEIDSMRKAKDEELSET